MVAVFLILAVALLWGLIYCSNEILFKGNLQFSIYFLCVFLPFYVTIQALFFQYTQSPLIVNILRYLKEIVVFLAVVSWVFYRKDLFKVPINLKLIDYLFISIVAYSLLYTLLPIGPAEFINKLLYFKNILMLAIMYFLGRVMTLSSTQTMNILKIILSVTVLAFILNLFEKGFDTHFQSLIGYANLYQEMNDIPPAGIHGLSYTFGAESGAKRFAAFFANPLELAASVLISISTAFFLYLNAKGSFNKSKYGLLMILSIGCLLFAYSRSSILGFFLLIFFIAIILGYYRLIIYGLLAVLVFFGAIFAFAGDDLRYFVIDTLTLADMSSVGHVLEWLEGIESMASSPLGIGLASSGNAGGVSEELKIGGENQFIIFGVQLGIPFLLLYIALTAASILYAVKAYKRGINLTEKAIPFIAASFKFAFLLPLFTANAEIYLYAAYISWWMVGYSVSIYNRHDSKLIKSHS